MNEPFRFCMRLSLQFVSHGKAASARQLWEKIKEVPESSIYHHTHRFLQGYQFQIPEPPNDFAYWAKQALGNQPLGDALEAVDTMRYSSLGELRETLMSAVEPFKGADASAPEGKAFHFLSARRSSISTPHSASSFKEMSEALRHVSAASLYLHVFEARLRLPPGENDFSTWLTTEWDARELAEHCRRVTQSSKTLEDIRKELISVFEVAGGKHATA